jgi:hypothetical protein
MAAIVHLCGCAPALVRAVAAAGGIATIVQTAAEGKRFAKTDAAVALR